MRHYDSRPNGVDNRAAASKATRFIRRRRRIVAFPLEDSPPPVCGLVSAALDSRWRVSALRISHAPCGYKAAGSKYFRHARTPGWLLLPLCGNSPSVAAKMIGWEVYYNVWERRANALLSYGKIVASGMKNHKNLGSKMAVADIGTTSKKI